MEDVLRRLGSLEGDVSEIKTEVGAIRAVLPHLATKADVALVKAAVSDAKTSTIQWIAGTMIAMATIFFTIAKFVH